MHEAFISIKINVGAVEKWLCFTVYMKRDITCLLSALNIKSGALEGIVLLCIFNASIKNN